MTFIPKSINIQTRNCPDTRRSPLRSSLSTMCVPTFRIVDRRVITSVEGEEECFSEEWRNYFMRRESSSSGRSLAGIPSYYSTSYDRTKGARKSRGMIERSSRWRESDTPIPIVRVDRSCENYLSDKFKLRSCFLHVENLEFTINQSFHCFYKNYIIIRSKCIPRGI